MSGERRVAGARGSGWSGVGSGMGRRTGRKRRGGLRSTAAANRTLAQTLSIALTPPFSEPLQALEAEASQQSAFDPETNTINWDCPCLGGMADGPCGEEFKLAFSCFVFSEAEPKGIECVAKFQGMQDCFRRHPEIYAEELKVRFALAEERAICEKREGIMC